MAAAPEKVLILGTGFAAFSLIRNIDVERYSVVIVSPRNHFLFTPLLPSTTVGTIEFRSIIEPIRTARKGIRYHQAHCVRLDLANNVAHCEGTFKQTPFTVKYDKLVIAVGMQNNTYGIPGVTEHGKFLKELSDARAIRHEIIQCFERASKPDRPVEDFEWLLHFVVVGGGPTGVEFAAEMHDFATDDLSKWFPELKPYIRITLLEAGTQILTQFDKRLSEYAMKQFHRQRINLRTNAKVKEVRRRYVVLEDGEEIPYGLLVWSTGLAPRPIVTALDLPRDRQQRLITDGTFLVKGTANVYSIGDCATIEGMSLPATAQVAQQSGRHVAKVLNAMARGKTPPQFDYKHMGMMAYIGDHRALADIGKYKGRGITTWFFWRSAYLTKLMSWKNKSLVMFDWIKTYFFGRDISQI